VAILTYNHVDRWFHKTRHCGTQPRVPRRKSPIGKAPPPPAILKPLGAQLRRLRLERELSQEQLAELAGLHYKYIGRVELSKAEPGADVLVRLARALAVPVGELFDTITPASTSPYRLSPGDIDSITAALEALTTVVDRVLGRQPRPLPVRSPRKTRV
jgi:transcriptional regulator with XRE-family HTH domain